MARHSKNNTASGVFTYAERQMTNYGTKRQRLNTNNKRNFDACHLCLHESRDPVTCTNGHLACRECVLRNMLEQKKAAKQKKRAAESAQKREEAEEERERIDEKHRSISEHARTMVGIKDRPEKRKREEKELASFWVPANTPDSTKRIKGGDKVADKVQMTCNAEEPPHALRMKDLVSVKFRVVGGEKLCPACDRAFTNSSKIEVADPCGHVFCRRCAQTFLVASNGMTCFVCQQKVKRSVQLASEGTGFAAAGGILVATKYDNALQA